MSTSRASLTEPSTLLPSEVISPLILKDTILSEQDRVSSGPRHVDNVRLDSSIADNRNIPLPPDLQHSEGFFGEIYRSTGVASIKSQTLEAYPALVSYALNRAFIHAQAGFQRGADPQELFEKLVLQTRWDRWYALQEGVTSSEQLKDFLREQDMGPWVPIIDQLELETALGLTTAPANKRLSSIYWASMNTYRLSQDDKLQHNQLSSFSSDEINPTKPASSSQPQNLISERLGLSHDAFLFHLSSLLGRLQAQSLLPSQLALPLRQLAFSGGHLLVIIDMVYADGIVSADALEKCRAAMYYRLRDLMSTARNIINQSGNEWEEVITPQDNRRLSDVAVSCVKVTGECVAKTRWVIERIGDFEFELHSG